MRTARNYRVIGCQEGFVEHESTRVGKLVVLNGD